MSIRGRIMSVSAGLYTVRCETGETIEKIPARGIFRHNGIKPLVGDIAEVMPEAGSYVVDSISERKNCIIRPALANLDLLFVVIAAKKPLPVTGFADKLTVMCEKNGITPCLIITKSELDPMGARELAEVYRRVPYHSFVLSSVTGEGIKEFDSFRQDYCRGKVSAFAGASGVGKSTLMNRLFPHIGCATGDISHKIQRGKNTTRSVTLYETEKDTYLADTPGFTMLEFEEYDICSKDDLPLCFPEFDRYIGTCKYTKCSHTKEEGCSIIGAVNRGDISKSRHESFVKLYNDVKNKRQWDK